MPGAKARSQKTRDGEAARLRLLRKALGWTQRRMAQEFLVSPGAIALWEQSDRHIPGPVLKLIEIYERRRRGRGSTSGSTLLAL
jgi:DNA-binding transcriptional regulator YiaG